MLGAWVHDGVCPFWRARPPACSRPSGRHRCAPSQPPSTSHSSLLHSPCCRPLTCALHRAAGCAGTIKATCLIETLPAAFEMDEFIYELRDHMAGGCPAVPPGSTARSTACCPAALGFQMVGTGCTTVSQVGGWVVCVLCMCMCAGRSVPMPSPVPGFPPCCSITPSSHLQA